MKTSRTGINLICSFEGLRLTAYKAIPTEKFYTIGYGHYGKDVTKNMRITKARAEELLTSDLVKFENAVNNLKLDLNQNQFDALVSFSYNCGTTNLKKLVANRTLSQIADAMLLYNKANSKVLSGLVKRRKAERELFLKKDTVNDLTVVAREVIEGKWGNGAVRRAKLTASGYNYAMVQAEVNRLLRGY